MNSKKVSIRIRLPREISRSYDIVVGAHSTKQLFSFLRKNFRGYQIAIVTDTVVRKLYGTALNRELTYRRWKTRLFSFPAGERSKTITTKTQLEHRLFRVGCARDTVILALGGGVVGDIAGFVAATYMRGVPYIQIPTTFLAMVDSSIGGKTGVNTPYGKNLLGVFWQPSCVFVDTAYLATLPTSHLTTGFVEALKMFVILDRSMFAIACSGYSSARAYRFITRTLALKAEVVTRDEKELGERMILNFGHTIGHALEKASGYRLLHGIAVGLGMMVEAAISQRIGLLPLADFRAIVESVRACGIDQELMKQYIGDSFFQALRCDKKNKNGEIRCVLLERIGKVYTKGGIYAHAVDMRIVKQALEFQF